MCRGQGSCSTVEGIDTLLGSIGKRQSSELCLCLLQWSGSISALLFSFSFSLHLERRLQDLDILNLSINSVCCVNVEIPCPYLAEGLINLLSAEHTLSLFVSLWQPFSPTQLPALQKMAFF